MKKGVQIPVAIALKTRNGGIQTGNFEATGTYYITFNIGD